MSNRPVHCTDKNVDIDINVPTRSMESFEHFRPADRLQGELRISSSKPLQINRVQLYLCGSSLDFTFDHIAATSRWSIVLTKLTGVESVVTVSTNLARHSKSRKVGSMFADHARSAPIFCTTC